MNGKTIVASIIVGILGLISTGVGLTFAVLPFKNQIRLLYFRCTNDLCVVHECLYFRSPMFYMIVAAIVCLIVALILISISADCGCGRATNSSSSSRALAILAFVCCWLTCTPAIILFLYAGATHYGIRISKNGGSISFTDASSSIGGFYRSCFKVNHGVFGAAAALSFVGIALGIISYITLVYEDHKIRRANQARRGSTNELQ
ncbi:uncharacterized protein LOC110725372 [Chenopodium quinoa]|uniref:uncharacterized protein LOC110725372 n=1 Tax=Chenopodium quinoa TaxID=63459 RepID=UPI000B794A3B|nr:uncharacterized protein LOC110725372 [Chenopodium quinoa]